MNPSARFYLELRPDPPTPGQFSDPKSLATVPGDTAVGGFLDPKGRLTVLWRRASAQDAPPSRVKDNDPVLLELAGPTGRSRLAKGEVTPRSFAWFTAELREGSAVDWARRWDGGLDSLLERSGALLLGVFVPTATGSRRVSLLVAAHRYSELETAWRRLASDNGFRTRVAAPVLRGLSLPEAVRLSPLPWSEVQ